MNHSFDINLASEFGILEAILIHHFQHWIAINKRMSRNKNDGRTWTYQTNKEILANFPYITNRFQLARALKNLVDKGVLLKGNYNKNRYDHTIWYAFNDENRFLPRVKEDPTLREDETKTEQSNVQKCTNEGLETLTQKSGNAQSIPDTKNRCLNNNTSESVAIAPSVCVKNPPSDKKSYGEHSNCKLTDKEVSKLKQKFGEEGFNEWIETIDLEAEKKGEAAFNKKYKSHYATILSWEKRASKQIQPCRSNVPAAPQACTNDPIDPILDRILKEREAQYVDEDQIFLKEEARKIREREAQGVNNEST